MNSEEELDFFHKHWEEAYIFALEKMISGKQAIGVLARERYKDNHVPGEFFEGYTVDMLVLEILEELADAVAWGVGRKWHELNDSAASV
jgi:hypothetical protein